jgi:Na+-transporting methylmalonyl-CoA/oxaloacetate decarboxylase gamma subunit
MNGELPDEDIENAGSSSFGEPQASKLPRSQQEKIAAVIEAFVNQHSDREV